MDNQFTLAETAAQSVLTRAPLRPQIGLVLGSGLGGFADSLTDSTRVPYAEIPAFPQSTAIGHAGQMVIGKAGGVAVAAMQGRVHLYEGYSAQQVTFPIRVFGRMGIRAVILTNAAGGINLSYSQGALVLIRDHINLQGTNPLVGPNDDHFGVRFPDMTEAYAKSYREFARAAFAKHGLTLHEGVSPGLLPPTPPRPGRNVNGGERDRPPPHGNQSARSFLRNQHGRRNSRPTAFACRSNGNRRARKNHIRRPAPRRPPGNRRRRAFGPLR